MKTRRVTLRTMMIAAALSALPAWGVVLWRRSERFALEARKHYNRLDISRFSRDTYFTDFHQIRDLQWSELSDDAKARVADWDRWILFEEQMVRKYLRAAVFPWIAPGPAPRPPATWVFGD